MQSTDKSKHKHSDSGGRFAAAVCKITNFKKKVRAKTFDPSIIDIKNEI